MKSKEKGFTAEEKAAMQDRIREMKSGETEGEAAVLAKIAVLVFIIVFIQKRPQGLFALKGRTVEA